MDEASKVGVVFHGSGEVELRWERGTAQRQVMRIPEADARRLAAMLLIQLDVRAADGMIAALLRGKPT